MKISLHALALAGLIVGGCASPDATQNAPSDATLDSVQSLPKRAIDRGTDIETDSNINQINQALSMIKADSGPPATLAEAKRAVKVPDEMWFDKVSQKPLVYDVASGTVQRAGVAPGAPPSAGTKNAPSGINIPGGGGY